MSLNTSFHRIKNIINLSLASLAALSLVAYTPLSAYALDASTPSPTACSPTTAGSGIHQPNGADAATYTYNCAGYWENDHFIYQPDSGVYRNKIEPTYTYNISTSTYDYPVWVYNAPSGSFVAVTNSTDTPPTGASVVGAPVTLTAPAADQSIVNTGSGSNNQITSDGSGGAAAISGTGANSNNTISSTGRDSLTGNFTTVATVNNTLNSTANSGAVTLSQNTTTGDAASGNAAAMANIVNLLQSTSNALGKDGNTVTFVANINGDVNGDLLLNPAMLGLIQPAGSQPSGNTALTVNDQTNASINNNIKLSAASGNTTSSQNTTAGDATTGNAQAVANIVNVIDSAITAGKSFFGVININGNLNGDILLPPNFVDQLLAANVPTVQIDTTGANSTNGITNTASHDTAVTNVANEGINNNVTASAASGNVNSTQNTTAGNATSGTAKTNITAFNLTGNNVIGGNDLLVFVNVLGQWVGLIVNAPAGANAAALGGGITTNAPTGNTSTTINKNTNEQINNNVTVAAKSGDVSQTQNTSAGNATSGNADVAVNLLNIAHSSLSLSNWFGVLFINVFGSWHGSFGVNTAYGNPIVSPTESLVRGSATGVASTAASNYKVFSFVPKAAATTSQPVASTDNTVAPTNNANDKDTTSGQTLGTHTVKIVAATPNTRPASRSTWLIPSIAIGGLMLIFLGKDAYAAFRKPGARK